jgi:hypothetical protein
MFHVKQLLPGAMSGPRYPGGVPCSPEHAWG